MISGEVYGIGRNTDHALGLGTWCRIGDREENWKYSTLERIADLPDDVTGITATVGCAIAWTRSGSAYGWGCDTVGQLGLGAGDGTVIDKPQQIASKHLDGYKIISVSLADSHALILAKAIDQPSDIGKGN